jgi:hypothetical protein
MLKWIPPQPNDCPILFYTVSYRKKETTGDAKEWTAMNITDPTVNQHELMLNCSTTYEFQVTAWNELGDLLSSVQSTTTGGFARKDDTADLSTSGTDLLFIFMNLSLKRKLFV